MPPVILVTGSNGQVGRELTLALAPLSQVVALDRAGFDLSDPERIADALARVAPDLIVNAAAYTAVDKAESEPDLVFAINAQGPGLLAQLAQARGIPLIHYSSDYVFAGDGTAPYREDDPKGPVSVYGASKLAGEEAIRAATPRHVILRTSWVFAAHGQNFLRTMLNLAATRDSLNIVADQIGAPTSAALIARVTAELVQKLLADQAGFAYGTYHLAAAGQTSWHGYAAFLIGQARQMGFAVKLADKAIKPIPASANPTPAARPANSRLDTAKLQSALAHALPRWEDGVMDVLGQLARERKV